MTSKSSSIDHSTHTNPNPKKKHKKKKSKHADQNPSPSPSPTTLKKETPMVIDHLPAPIDSPETKQPESKDSNDGDSLTILEAIIKFQSNNGGNNPTPTTMKPLYDSVKGSLGANYTLEKLYSRIRHLRARYYRWLETGHVGDSVTDRAFFDLSARAWRGSKKPKTEENGITNGIVKKLKTEYEDEVDGLPMADAEDGVGDSFKFLNHHAKEYWALTGMNVDNLEMGLQSMNRAKAKALERKWVQHAVLGLKIQGKQTELEMELFGTLLAAQKGMD